MMSSDRVSLLQKLDNSPSNQINKTLLVITLFLLKPELFIALTLLKKTQLQAQACLSVKKKFYLHICETQLILSGI